MFDEIDDLKRQLLDEEGTVAKARARQVRLLRRLVSAQVAMHDGYASTEDWAAGWLDVAPETAAALVKLSRWLGERAPATADLDAGRVSFDRAVAETGLVAAGAAPDRARESRDRDIRGVRRLTARQRLQDPVDEAEAFADRHLVLQPNLDESTWRIHGSLPGIDGRIVEKALHQRGDEMPCFEDGSRPSVTQRNADALTSLCQDSLTGVSEDGAESGEPHITVFVDATVAAASRGMRGIEVEGGPPIGVAALSELLCNGRIDITAAQNGRALAVGDSQAVVPPRLRRYILWRDGGCVIDGCSSRYRLQIHHLVPRFRGGTNREGNLVTLCWFHHHVAIHGHGFGVDFTTPPQRRRLMKRRPNRAPPPRSHSPEPAPW